MFPDSPSSSSSTPASSTPPLPTTLAQRVRHLREQRMMSVEYLAYKTQVPVQMIEDIEAGIETFMAPAVRQRIARLLHVRPAQLQEVEKAPAPDTSEAATLQRKSLDLHEAILQDPDAPHVCPSCEAPLRVRVFERYDLRNRPLLVFKVNCTRCLFRLADD